MKFSPAHKNRAAFTMIEVAICLAIIGIALVGIIGVLPRGMNTQRDNRELTIVGQDANQLIEIIRNGARSQDDLTNYIYAITNYWVAYNSFGVPAASGSNGYTYFAASLMGNTPSPNNPFLNLLPINSGSNIVSLLSTPEFIGLDILKNGTDNLGQPILNVYEGGISNHVVAYVRALSGLAAEKPPQDNNIMQGDSFTYRVLCVNAPMAMDTEIWTNTSYNPGIQIYHLGHHWFSTTNTVLNDEPGNETAGVTNWVRNYYLDQLATGEREIRLRFNWPQLPNGKVGGNYQNFRVTVGGQLVATNNAANVFQYFYQPQTYTALQ